MKFQIIMSPFDRFMSKVSRQQSESGCWLWMASCNQDGYGKFSINRKELGAHRASWQLMRGPIPSGELVLHHCDVPRCVNPEHLYLGSQADNMRDRLTRGRLRNGSEGQTHCKNGHPLSGSNLCSWRLRGPRPARQCKTCHNSKTRLQKALKRKQAKLISL